MAKNKKSGPRPKHIPVRTCVACRRTDAKRGLFRLVRDAEGRVTVDPTGKQAGRGAYLCHDPACWEQALKRRGLERARPFRDRIDAVSFMLSVTESHNRAKGNRSIDEKFAAFCGIIPRTS